MSPASRFPRPTTSDITKTGVELPPEASEGLDKELEFERVESRVAPTVCRRACSSPSWR